MKWDITFFSKQDFIKHVRVAIRRYISSYGAMDLKKFNKNIIDPIKLTFDSKVYDKTMDQVIEAEIVRQRDKSNNNIIGDFHQGLFKLIKNCEVPHEGFDVIYHKDNSTNICVELKNKHNTMNSSSSQETFMRMQKHIIQFPSDICYLVEVIAKSSQNVIWNISLKSQRIANERIRRVSIDRFYAEITGDKHAFLKICNALPEVIDEIISKNPKSITETNLVTNELTQNFYPDLLKSLYKMAFSTYLGFEKL